LSSPDRALAISRPGIGLGARLAIVGGVLLLEKTFLNLFVDFASAQSAEGLGAVLRVTQHWGFRFLVSFAIAAAVFGYLRGGRRLQDVDVFARALPAVRPLWLLAHVMLFLPLIPLSFTLYGRAAALPLAALVVVWLLVATLAAAALFASLGTWALFRQAVHALGNLWWYAALAAAGAALAMGWTQGLWTGMATLTFEVVYRLLSWLVPTLQVDPASLLIDTGHFGVVIAPICSGLEGMGLMLAFCTVLLVVFRREYIFPRALLLIPAGVLLSFALNIARIAALVLIGDAGYQSIAVYGFHSQAGWIAFNAAAVGIALVSLRSSWFSRAAAAERSRSTAVENPTAVYLLPYLVLLLAGMLSRAVSGGFEDLYWLRLVAGGVALGFALPRLRGTDWRFTWKGALAGLLAFVLWMVAARFLLPPQGMPPALAALAPVSRAAWVTGHILVSVAVMPLVEELAFRGYLMRRLRSADFESVAPGDSGPGAVIISAGVFGLCQGAHWLPGVLTGLIFGLLYLRTGRLGESVAAHVILNALIAVAVVAGSLWQLW
jgi:exosortase E/protease (VPEID-CTERM system)